MIQVYALGAFGTNDPAQIAAFAKDSEWVGMRAAALAAFGIVLFGI